MLFFQFFASLLPAFQQIFQRFQLLVVFFLQQRAHKNADVMAIDTAITELNAAWQAASQDIYAQQQAQGAQPGADAGQQSQANAGNASNGDSSQPEDVEFEEVK